VGKIFDRITGQKDQQDEKKHLVILVNPVKNMAELLLMPM